MSLKNLVILGYVTSSDNVRMEEDKVMAITILPVPTTGKELQRFLGFANFSRRFIGSYSSLISPLTNLLKKNPKHLQWNQEADRSFQLVKSRFVTAPILAHPDPNKPFIIKPTDIGAVIEGVEVINELPSVAHAFAMLFGFIYVLKLSYPSELRHTFLASF